MSETQTHIDFDRAYRVAGYGGVAWWAIRYATENVYEGDYLACDDEDCDHTLSEMCWCEGDWSVVIDYSMVIMRMVGDDRDHIIDVDDLTPISEDDYCAGCGQIGCGWH